MEGLPAGKGIAQGIHEAAQAITRAADAAASAVSKQVGTLTETIAENEKRFQTTDHMAARPMSSPGDSASLPQLHGSQARLDDDPATGKLRAIYGPALRTDGSELAKEYARSLGNAPTWLHHGMAEFMRAEPDGLGGIWLGGRGLPDLGHPTFAFDQPPRGYPPGTTWHDIAGAYHRRALLVGTGGSEGGTAALHEFSHGVDDLADMASHQAAFERTYDVVTRHLREIDPKLAEYFTQSGIDGREELFAEGLGWFYSGGNLNDFHGSTAIAWHLDDYFRELEPRLRWATA